jgi:Ca-activated chloride channel family protein
MSEKRLFSFEVTPVHATLKPDERSTEHLLIRVGAPTVVSGPRPRLTVIFVLDVSGSMRGTPLQQVIQSTQRLVEILGDDDRVGVVSFSDAARTVSPLRVLNATARKATVAEIGALTDEGSTNMSGGIAHAALLFPQREPGERHLILLMSDGQPNSGARTIPELSEQVRLVRQRDVALCTLGYGAHHDEELLIALADAGGGRYAFVDDPVLAGPSFARALGAQRDVVGEELRVTLSPSEGVEIVRLAGDPPTSFGSGGLRVTLQDAIAGDELNLVVELKVKTPRETGPWRSVVATLSGKSPSEGTIHQRAEAAVSLSRIGPYPSDPTAEAIVAIALASDLRKEARGNADRGNFIAAAAILERALQLIDETPGYSGEGADGPLHDAHETLLDEIAAMKSKPDPEKYRALKLAQRDYADFKTQVGRVTQVSSNSAAEMIAQMLAGALPKAQLVAIAGPLAGAVFPLGLETGIGRAVGNAISVGDAGISRHQSRIVFSNGEFVLVDLGSSNGSFVNGQRIANRRSLVDGDVIGAGTTELRFELL